MKFNGTLQLDSKTATGIPVPEEIVTALAGGNHPRVRVTLAGHSYQTSVGRRRGEFKLPVSAAMRQETGLAAGDRVEVEIELDDAPRELSIPDELAEALARHPRAREAFDRLSYSNRKRHALAIESARTIETRQRRLAKTLDELQSA